ncbi:MAG: hypothetical protein MR208_06950 [Oscillospiraceae bacterium]|nr:hypothetical protein [Oscillospiraceae bacterium]
MTRHVYAEAPPCVEYSLTETGYGVTSVPGCLFREKAAKQAK